METFYEFSFILGTLLSCFYAVVLYKTNKGLPRNILTVIFLFLIFIFLESYGFIRNSFPLFVVTYIPAFCSQYFIGALLFLYINALFYDDKIVLKKYGFVLLVPVLVMAFYGVPYLIGRVSKQYFLGHVSFFESYHQYIRLFSKIVLFVYLIFCYRSFLKLKKVMKCTYSNIAYNNFIWIRYVLVGTILVISLDLFFVNTQLFFNTFTTIRTQNLTVLALAIFIINMGFYGLHQSKVLVPYFLLDEDERSSKEKTQYLTNNEKAEFKDLSLKLKSVFENQKAHLDVDLTLNKLAKQIGVTNKKLSTLLNHYLEVSFYDFVNEYRVNEFKNALKNNHFEGYTIEGISNECGFKSKASFYRSFKLKTNMSPSEYKKSLI